ncbi:hypothetical protein HJFPF1_02541 [Paramyrothecium foliicola]|nr:hypothetical protein HJFPF1_02541 [Paramyrothecium foliicola]
MGRLFHFFPYICTSIMRYSIVAAALATASTAAAQNFRVVANFGGNSQVRTWYGDGNLYVGALVPEGLEKALNFTIPDWNAGLPRAVVGPVAPATETDLAPGSFLAVNTAAGATDAVTVVQPDGELPEEGRWVDQWLRYGRLLLPRGSEATTSPPFYLEPTEVEGTFRVTWRTPGEGSAGDGGLRRIGLEAVL